MGDTIQNIVKHPAFGPAGIFLGAGIWSGFRFGLKKLNIDAGMEVVNTLVALLLTGAYIYMWTQGNPHDGELKELGDVFIDLPLVLLGGYYLTTFFPFRGLQASYGLLAMSLIISILVEQKGSNVGDVFFFAMEAPVVMNLAIKIMECFEPHECLMLIFKAFTALFYGATRLLGAGYTVMKLVEKDDAPVEIRALAALAYGVSLLFIVNFIETIKGCEDSPPPRSRSSSRSRSQSKGRAKQRSRSRTPKRRRC